MNPRLLILTAGFGEGHNAAARALSAEHESLHGSGSAPVIDALALAAPRLNAVSRRVYLRVINGWPAGWGALYRWLDRSRVVRAALGRSPAEQRVLRDLIARQRPAAVVCTFPGYMFTLAALARGGAVLPPAFSVVTDSISINSLWWRAGGRGWFVPNAATADVMKSAGVDPDRIDVTGFPVDPFFRRNEGEWMPPELGPGVQPRVLYIVNSGRSRAPETAERLLRETDWEITCTVGRDDELRRRLLAVAAGRRARTEVLGWTNEIPRLLMTHHVVVSKAGGATTQEALAARCPMVVNQIVPGQEEGNYELLRRHGVGALATNPEQVLAALRAAFADGAALWNVWRRAVAPLSRPRAAQEILALVLAKSNPPTGSAPRPVQEITR